MRHAVSMLSTAHHDRLKTTDFEFNDLDPSKSVFLDSDPAASRRLGGKSTEYLVNSLYDKVPAIRLRNAAPVPDPMNAAFGNKCAHTVRVSAPTDP